ncbi:MAG: DUF3795 domain-containing protein [Coriobacteriales bacterium]|jgi:hypothetical protein|nr:DUF3795 domain-containing protein [Coriobacteriales bacterium]
MANQDIANKRESYARKYPLFSQCGLNCGLCPRYHTQGVSKCPGCGGVATGTHEFVTHCGVNSCANRHGGVEYCCQCGEYPCKKYYDSENIKDSFITKQHQLADFQKVKDIGLAAYQAELKEKVGILERLLADFNDGRRKNFFCLAVNLLELADIRDVMTRIKV